MISKAGHSILRQMRTQLRLKPGSTPVATLSASARLLSSLAVLEQRDGKLNHGSLGAVTAAQKLGGSITGFVAGSNIKAVAEEAAKVKGIEKVIAVDNGAYDKVCHWTGFNDTLAEDFIGITRELCPITGREYQEGRVYSHYCWTHSIRQESHAQSCSVTRRPTNIRYHDN